MEITSAGESSHTDIAICYMENRVDKQLLDKIKKRIQNLKVDALTMNQESLAECLFPYKWFNPFPKFKFSERPDTAAASILEGNIIILVDNSPSAMILPPLSLISLRRQMITTFLLLQALTSVCPG